MKGEKERQRKKRPLPRHPFEISWRSRSRDGMAFHDDCDDLNTRLLWLAGGEELPGVAPGMVHDDFQRVGLLLHAKHHAKHAEST